jgi:hypothetical protein
MMCPYCQRDRARIAEETIRADRYTCPCGGVHWRCQWPTSRGARSICGAVIVDGHGRPAAELQRWCVACQSVLSVDAPRPVVGGER